MSGFVANTLNDDLLGETEDEGRINKGSRPG